MQQILRSLTAAFLAAAFVQLSCPVQAQPVAEPPPKQIALTEKQVLAFIAAQKDIQPILEKIQGPSADELPPTFRHSLAKHFVSGGMLGGATWCVRVSTGTSAFRMNWWKPVCAWYKSGIRNPRLPG